MIHSPSIALRTTYGGSRLQATLADPEGLSVENLGFAPLPVGVHSTQPCITFGDAEEREAALQNLQISGIIDDKTPSMILLSPRRIDVNRVKLSSNKIVWILPPNNA